MATNKNKDEEMIKNLSKEALNTPKKEESTENNDLEKLNQAEKKPVNKNNVVPNTVSNLSNADLDRMIRNAGEGLKKQKKVKIVIPIDNMNPEDKYVPVGINGYNFQIERGKEVEVPVEVARILTRAVPPLIYGNYD